MRSSGTAAESEGAVPDAIVVDVSVAVLTATESAVTVSAAAVLASPDMSPDAGMVPVVSGFAA
jgi:hypothetical protein